MQICNYVCLYMHMYMYTCIYTYTIYLYISPLKEPEGPNLLMSEECRRAPVPPWHDNDNIVITLSNKVRWSVGQSLSTLSYLMLRTTLQLWAHFKFGVYEHQPAGMQPLEFVASGAVGIADIHIIAYGLNVGIIGEPAISCASSKKALKTDKVPGAMDDAWMDLMLSPWVSGKDALYWQDTRAMMVKISFSHGGPEPLQT